MKKFKFNIKGMHCKSCSILIENELNDHEGILVAKVNDETGKASSVYNENKITESEIKKLVERSGNYEVSGDDDNKNDDDSNKSKNNIVENKEAIKERKEEKNTHSDDKGSLLINKQKLLFGAVLVIGIIATTNFFVTMKMYFSQKNVVNAQAIVVEDAADDNYRPAPTPPSRVDIAINDDDHIRGEKDAPITIVEFSDFQCPYCQSFHSTMQQIVNSYPNEVRWVYKHFPLDSIHPLARRASEASECAGEQGKFWEYTDQVFDNQRGLTEDSLSTIARSVGLNVNKFDACLDSGKYTAKVEADYQAGIDAGVRGTPGNFINEESVPGALPYEQIKTIVESLL